MANAPVNNSIYDHDKTSRRFRCDVCEDKWPESRLVVQDGAFVCKDNCWYPGGSRVERDLMEAKAATVAALSTAQHAVPPIYPGAGLMVGQPGIEKISPYPTRLIRGGSAGTISMKGVNLTSANTTVTGDSLGITIASTTVASTSLLKVTASASGATEIGKLYDMTVNGHVYRGAFRVVGSGVTTPIVYAISPYPVTLAIGGSSVDFSITGANLTTTVGINSNGSGVTLNNVRIFSGTLTIAASADVSLVAGNYDMTINGEVYFSMFKVV